jgi:vacuolar-type H+-ATPase subunit I/STV1
MSNELKGLYKFGGISMILSGVLFLTRAVLERIAGPPPSNGVEILAWIESSKVALSLVSEILFFAGIALVPAVIALSHSLVGIDRVKTALGCGIIAAMIPVLIMLLIVHGRLVYPVYGIRIATPPLAEFAVALFYGGFHAIDLMMGIAVIVLSLAMMHGVYGKGVAYLGIATGSLDIVGSYPYAIGPILTLGCQAFFAAWLVLVGWKLRGLR